MLRKWDAEGVKYSVRNAFNLKLARLSPSSSSIGKTARWQSKGLHPVFQELHNLCGVLIHLLHLYITSNTVVGFLCCHYFCSGSTLYGCAFRIRIHMEAFKHWLLSRQVEMRWEHHFYGFRNITLAISSVAKVALCF